MLGGLLLKKSFKCCNPFVGGYLMKINQHVPRVAFFLVFLNQSLKVHPILLTHQSRELVCRFLIWKDGTKIYLASIAQSITPTTKLP